MLLTLAQDKQLNDKGYTREACAAFQEEYTLKHRCVRELLYAHKAHMIPCSAASVLNFLTIAADAGDSSVQDEDDLQAFLELMAHLSVPITHRNNYKAFQILGYTTLEYMLQDAPNHPSARTEEGLQGWLRHTDEYMGFIDPQHSERPSHSMLGVRERYRTNQPFRELRPIENRVNNIPGTGRG